VTATKRPPAGEVDAFAESRQQFETVLGWLDAADAGALEHAELERRLEDAGRELLRRLLQDHLTCARTASHAWRFLTATR